MVMKSFNNKAAAPTQNVAFSSKGVLGKPRVKVAHLPTPLERLDRLSDALGGKVNIWIKRDDCTGVSTGGNKARKLEYLVADAIQQGADVLITQGATQSNHARQTASFAAKFGMSCYILLEERVKTDDMNYNLNGNVLLDHLHGASTEHRPAGTNMQEEMEKLASALRREGKNPYVIVGGGSDPIGASGYANCAAEIANQAEKSGLCVDYVVHATGSAGTQAGLVAGFQALAALKDEPVADAIQVLGIGVRAPKSVQEENVFKLACRTVAHLGFPEDTVKRDDVVANTDYVGEGYGIPSNDTWEAIKIFARTEGILLDPVYSGKGAAGLVDLVRKGHFKPGSNIVFIHTGGSSSLFAYTEQGALVETTPFPSF